MAAHLSVVFDVVSERDEARLELLRVESSRARLVEVEERASELFQLLVADALRVARQDLLTRTDRQTDRLDHSSTSDSTSRRSIVGCTNTHYGPFFPQQINLPLI